MSDPHQRIPRPRRSAVARRVAAIATGIALLAGGASASLLATAATGDDAATRATSARAASAAKALATLEAAAKAVPAAVDGECVKTATVPGQGPSCRLPDGTYLVPQQDGEPMRTHGPDVVEASGRAARAGGFGSVASIACSPASRTRHVQLMYLLPSDHAAGTDVVHGDRFDVVADQLRQALYDASETVDRRAQQLAGQRRRIRAICDEDGRPSVLRVVLPHTAAEYVNADNGFRLMGDDLAAMGHLPEYDGFSASRLPNVRRVLAYYDAEFKAGYAGQGTLFPRTSMIGQGIAASDPMIGRTSRNINNNPPRASLAVQYGSGTYEGATLVPDPPLFTSLLHELAHTMGAVQDETPTASGDGHCSDGLDVMCYDDGGTAGGGYRDDVCPDPAPPYAPEDEVFDCNGDTYFHPAPPAGSQLNEADTWHLGLAANETFATSSSAAPAAVTGLTQSGVGTRRTLRWNAATGAVAYEVGYRRAGGAWEYQFVSRTSAQPPLRPSASYEVRVAAIASGLVAGPASGALSLRTGLDNTPPTLPGGVAATGVLRTSTRLRFVYPSDNVRIVKFRVERRSGTRWVAHTTITAPRGVAAGERVTSPTIGSLRPAGRYVLRLRAIDGRGNVSAPSRAVSLTTRR